MSATALMSVEEYLRLTGKPYSEFRDGEVSVKAMPTKEHSLVQSELVYLFRRMGVQPYTELTLRLSPTRYLVPDVAVGDDFPGSYPIEPVLLCCEILSPDDRLSSMLSKCEEYHQWGVPYCWVIDPFKRTAWEYHLAGALERVSVILRAGELSVGLDELFGRLPHGE